MRANHEFVGRAFIGPPPASVADHYHYERPAAIGIHLKFDVRAGMEVAT